MSEPIDSLKNPWFIGKNRTSIISVSVIAGILSVVFSSIAFTIQYAIGGTISIPVGTVLIAMVTTHLIIGLGEGIITALIITLLMRVRPDLVYAYDRSEENTTKVSCLLYTSPSPRDS